jgi:hypothetical protein
MRTFHIASEVDARPTGKRAKLLHGQLLHTRFRVEASSRAESRKAGVLFNALKQVSDYSGDRVISAQPFVKRLAMFRGFSLHARSIVPIVLRDKLETAISGQFIRLLLADASRIGALVDDVR